MAIDAWGLSELWGGGITTSEIDPSAPRLSSIILNTFNLALLPHLFLLSFFWIVSLPLFPTTTTYAAVRRQSPLIYIWSPPPLLVRSANHLDVACNRHQSASNACPCTPRHMTASTAVSHAGALHPFPSLAYTQVLFNPWGVHLLRVHMRLCVPTSPSMRSPPNTGIVRSLVSLLDTIKPCMFLIIGFLLWSIPWIWS